MSKDIQKEWLKVNRLCKEIIWLSYDPDYKDVDLKKAVEILKELRAKLEKELEK